MESWNYVVFIFHIFRTPKRTLLCFALKQIKCKKNAKTRNLDLRVLMARADGILP